uniref:RNase H type-1 domain-containing protein n=1 Tax=Cannabis sativa TaxID=3483 RepID=A0A803NXA2_CANSA
MEHIICTLWCIWTERNQVVHGKSARSAVSLAAFSSNYLNNFCAAQLKYKQPVATSSLPPASAATPTLWQPPLRGHLKLNVDAAIDESRHIIGVGAVVRNSSGHAIAVFSMPTVGHFSSHEMEAKAMFLNLNWVLQLQLPIILVETDALLVSNALNSNTVATSSFKNLIINISSLLFYFPNISVTHVKRTANVVSDSLA